MATDCRKSPASIVEESRVPEAGGQEGQGKVKAEKSINYSIGVIKHLSEVDTRIFVLIMTFNNAAPFRLTYRKTGNMRHNPESRRSFNTSL